MKPDWKDAPEWAQWLCCDRGGGWRWFEKEPVWNRYLGFCVDEGNESWAADSDQGEIEPRP